MNERIKELDLQAQRRLGLITDAIDAVRFAAEEDRKITHDNAIDPYYREALDRLEVKRAGMRAYAFRVKTLGR
jgi:hypothetical protein